MSKAGDDASDDVLALLDQLVTSTGDAAFLIGEDSKILAWNEAAEKLLQRPVGEVIGLPCHEVLRGKDNFGNRYCDQGCAIQKMTRRQEPVRAFELQVGKTDRQLVRVRVSLLSIPVGEGHAMLHVLHPIGEAAPATRSSPDPGPRALVQELPTLTARELEVLRLLADGTSTEDLAETLFISVATVRTHVQSVIVKLDVHSKLQAVAAAYRLGIL